MRIDVLTLFPEMFDGPLQASILGRAVESGLVEIVLHNIRDYAEDKHHIVDDYPFGGGPGMVMKPEPLFAAVEAVTRARPDEGARRPPDAAGTPPDAGDRRRAVAAGAPHPRLRPLRGRRRARPRAPGRRRDQHRRLRALRRRAAGDGAHRRRRAAAARRAGLGGVAGRGVARSGAAGVPAVHASGRVPRLAGAGGAAFGPSRPDRRLATAAEHAAHRPPAPRSAGRARRSPMRSVGSPTRRWRKRTDFCYSMSHGV